MLQSIDWKFFVHSQNVQKTDAINTKESSPFADEEKDIIEPVDWTQ